jgi:hypothetical protein
MLAIAAGMWIYFRRKGWIGGGSGDGEAEE